MQEVYELPAPTIAQLSGYHPDGSFLLSVIAKRSYQVSASGVCVPAPTEALVRDPVMDPEEEKILAADTDLHHYKLRTDIVVKGHAYGYGQARQVEAVIAAGKYRHRIAVLGERRASLGPAGLRFSPPELIERVPLDFRYAYGGRDRAAEAKHGNPLLEDPEVVKSFKNEVDLDATSPFLYPRNPVGRGYLFELTREGVEQLSLPQLEDPLDLLTPERIVLGDLWLWNRMPVARAPGWIDYSWYPRIAFFGVVPITEVFAEPPIEVERKLLPDYLADGVGRTTPLSRFELLSGANVGLQVPHLRGGEAVELTHLHPRAPHWRFTLPRAPEISTDGRNGRLNRTEPVLHTLLLEPDRDRVTLVWRGSAKALRPYLPQERQSMPLRVRWS